jgi:hypothetical protein
VKLAVLFDSPEPGCCEHVPATFARRRQDDHALANAVDSVAHSAVELGGLRGGQGHDQQLTTKLAHTFDTVVLY